MYLPRQRPGPGWAGQKGTQYRCSFSSPTELAPQLAEPRAMEQVVICCAMIMVVFLHCAFEFQNHFDLY